MKHRTIAKIILAAIIPVFLAGSAALGAPSAKFTAANRLISMTQQGKNQIGQITAATCFASTGAPRATHLEARARSQAGFAALVQALESFDTAENGFRDDYAKYFSEDRDAVSDAWARYQTELALVTGPDPAPLAGLDRTGMEIRRALDRMTTQMLRGFRGAQWYRAEREQILTQDQSGFLDMLDITEQGEYRMLETIARTLCLTLAQAEAFDNRGFLARAVEYIDLEMTYLPEGVVDGPPPPAALAELVALAAIWAPAKTALDQVPDRKTLSQAQTAMILTALAQLESGFDRAFSAYRRDGMPG
jgi:hypothetical protein